MEGELPMLSERWQREQRVTAAASGDEAIEVGEGDEEAPRLMMSCSA